MPSNTMLPFTGHSIQQSTSCGASVRVCMHRAALECHPGRLPHLVKGSEPWMNLACFAGSTPFGLWDNDTFKNTQPQVALTTEVFNVFGILCTRAN